MREGLEGVCMIGRKEDWGGRGGGVMVCLKGRR